jgi:hypothetical protein
MTEPRTRLAVSLAAAILAISGAVLLFFPESLRPAATAGALPIGQLLGAALLGFAAMNWIARGAALGGIYGRAVVAGNHAHFTIGALVLLGRVLDAGADQPVLWTITGCYVAGACVFSYLQFFSTGLPER